MAGKPKKFQLKPTKIRLWREHRGKTLEETAELMSEYLRRHGMKKGYTHNTLGRLERGEFAYKQQVMEALSHVLNVDEGSLISRDPPEAGEPEREILVDIVDEILKRRQTR